MRILFVITTAIILTSCSEPSFESLEDAISAVDLVERNGEFAKLKIPGKREPITVQIGDTFRISALKQRGEFTVQSFNDESVVLAFETDPADEKVIEIKTLNE